MDDIVQGQQPPSSTSQPQTESSFHNKFNFRIIGFGLLFIIIVGVGVFLAGRNWQKINVTSKPVPTNTIVTPTNSLSLSSYFKSKIQESVGDTIEGYSAEDIIFKFQGLQLSDFDNVKTVDGIYKYSNSKLSLELNYPGGIKSESNAITDFDTLLSNISKRMDYPVKNIDDFNVLYQKIQDVKNTTQFTEYSFYLVLDRKAELIDDSNFADDIRYLKTTDFSPGVFMVEFEYLKLGRPVATEGGYVLASKVNNTWIIGVPGDTNYCSWLQASDKDDATKAFMGFEECK